MPALSRSQIAVYGGLAVLLLLLGARAIRAEGNGPSSPEASFSSSSGGSLDVHTGAGGDVVVDVTGAVSRPGVYRLPTGARVTDAVERAGGATGSAMLEAINLAAHLADGQQVVVPKKGPAGVTVAASGAGAGAEEGPISLGTATVEQLDTIDGIGPVTAQDILDFREAHGGLSSIDQLDQVSGMGRRRWKRCGLACSLKRSVRAGRPSRLAIVGVALLVALSLAHRGEIRERAEVAVGRDMPDREAALARGFVLGEDEEVDEATIEDFRRSGLSHLLAVSGQNVALLALLAMPVLAAFGTPLGTRLVWILGTIVVYVPLAGAGPSIVRAGVMGALTVLATLAGRRASRLYGLLVAAVVTLAIDPRIAADVGWQLSFAAVLGILALATPLRRATIARFGARGVARAVADGLSITVAATLATAPLIAFHFGAVSTTTLVANVLVLPAVAPAMWLGMLSAAAGQVPGFPTAALNAVAAPLLAYIAQIAAWCGGPSWAYLHVRLGLGGLFGAYAAIATAAILAPVWLRHRRLLRLRHPSPQPRCNVFSSVGNEKALHPQWGVAAALATLGVTAIALLALLWPGAGRAPALVPGLRVEVLDVGQGDAILFQPAHAPAVLVDGGPPGDDLAGKLHEVGADRLGAAVVTHEQSDHSGGIEELLGSLPVERLVYARLSRRLRGEATTAGAATDRMAQGGTIRSGALRLEALWPPRSLLAAPLAGADPNTQALVFLARWRDFSMLLTADAEAEQVPLDPGPVDVLKVAHHGSDDGGLAALLERTTPKLAVISVGAGNSYGHPTLGTLATLAAHRVPTLRTDLDGTVTLGVRPGSVEVETGD